jgi:hypothetical protein
VIIGKIMYNTRSMMEKQHTNSTMVKLSAIQPYIADNIVKNTETKDKQRDYIIWGEGNQYPNYLYSLYQSCATLQTIINGTQEYVMGSDITINASLLEGTVNKKGDTFREVIGKLVMDYLIFGGFAFQVIRNPYNEIKEIYYIDILKLRSDEKNEVFYYSDDWYTKSYGRVKTLVYPKYNPKDNNPTSIYFYKGNITRNTYPVCRWGSAVISAEIEKSIDEFHLNELNNNFMSSAIINFNNGTPQETEMEEIEKNIMDKFGGKENAGRILIAYNDNKDNAVTVERLNGDDYADRYTNLAKRSREQLFIAFRAVPVLFGLMTENNGFSREEFLQAFELYNKSTILPIQRMMIETFDTITGVNNSFSFVPFEITEKENISNND